MSFAFSHFHPNPGWDAGLTDPSKPSSVSAPEQEPCHADVNNVTDTVGKHCILELYECDPRKLDDEDFLRSAITNAALRAGATLIQLITHRFLPQGVTGLALLAESDRKSTRLNSSHRT